MIQLARQNRKGISETGCELLSGILRDYQDVLRIRLGKGKNAKFDPIVLDLFENARTIRAAHCR